MLFYIQHYIHIVQYVSMKLIIILFFAVDGTQAVFLISLVVKNVVKAFFLLGKKCSLL